MSGPNAWCGFFGDLSTPLLFGVVVSIVGWRAVAVVHGVFEDKRFDFVEDSVDMWRAAVVVGVPVGIIVLYVIMRRVEDRFAKHRWWPVLGKLALGVSVVWMLWHLCSGPFVEHFGALLPVGLVVLSTIAVAVWLPAKIEGRRGQIMTLAPLVLVAGLGYVGSGHVVARALLLHDTRVFPVVHATAFAFADRDGDGETGSWAGGPDCNDDDPRIASWRPEMPGNGVDENCRLGDGTEIPAANPEGEARPGEHVPVFLITLDTVRADRLDLLGHEREDHALPDRLRRECGLVPARVLAQ